ncbi:MAG: hypothetical protein IPL46_21875 [Saprospiraceae bacterium]|nr:hypothetical protein [Saprospiraceae bacterium]
MSFENYSFPDLDGTTGQVLGTNGSGNLNWVDGDDWSNNAFDIFRSTGSVVIGHSGVPLAKLEVNNANLMLPAGIFENTASNNNQAVLRAKTSGLWRGGEFEINNAANTAAAIYGLTNGAGTGLVINHNGSGGNLAIFQSSNANMARIDKTGKGYFNGGTVSSGADIAEAMVPEGKVQNYEYGDVMVISTHTDRSIEKSNVAYSSLVAGVYATKPGVLLTEENIDDDLTGHIPMGVIGIIPTKVCNEGGPIKRGDLLVTSSRPGVAMKADLSKLHIGQALGKALQNSDVDTDLINVLVNVQ